MSAARISVHTRKRLWARSGGLCAFPDCDQELLHSAERGREDTIVGKECHVVAQQDHPSVARSPSSLCDDERERYAALIEHRHHFANLILLCGVHSDVIDDPAQAYAIHDVLAMKQRHEKAMDFRRRSKLMVHSDDRHVSPDLVAETVRVTLLDDAPVWARKALAAMAKHDPEGLAWLHREVGDPAQPDRIADLVERWPPRLATGSEYLIQAVVRYAESAGLWREATSTWERLAERREGASKADALTRAAIDAGIGHEPELRERLLDAAASIDPDAPRMRLERLDQNASPADQLILLEELEADDPALSMLISCHRARAAMRLPDLDAAREHLEIARGIDPDAFLVRGTEVNMRIQEARIAVNDDRPFEIAAVRRAAKEALDLRDELIRMGRWGESGSLLMLAADTPCVLRDPSGATAILSRARPEELATPDGAHVLGDAALRAGAPELALEFTADAHPMTRSGGSARPRTWTFLQEDAEPAAWPR
jgi:tetratricopeptide (TPR) repeat protein